VHPHPKSSTELLLELVAQGVDTVGALAEALDLSRGRISQITHQLIQQNGRLIKCGRKFSVKNPTSEACELVKSAPKSAVSKTKQSEALYFSSADWHDFLDLGTLPRKAGCNPQDLPRVVFKEAADNACDAGRKVQITDWVDPKGNQGVCFHDDGPGLEHALVPITFSVNRARFSSKYIRRIFRGILGNGARVIAGTVAATGGTLMVETRGMRLWLQTDIKIGITTVRKSEPSPFEPGVKLHVALGPQLAWRREQLDLAIATVRISRFGHGYSGPSSPWWYGPHDFHRLIQEAQADAMSLATFARKCGFTVSGLSGPWWKRPVKDLSFAETQTALEALRQRNKPIAPKRLGAIGPTAFPGTAYAKKLGVVPLDGAELPYVIEAWAQCQRSAQKASGELKADLIVNRSMTPTKLHGASTPNKLTIYGCDLHYLIQPAPKPGNYNVTLSVITPSLPLTSEGKEPSLNHLTNPILETISKTARRAHGALTRPIQIEIKEVAWEIMEEAYLNASDNGQLPANARQIMYAARPYILEQTRLESFGDQYFTQTLLPDYLEEHPEETKSWDVVFDARGHAVEPHTHHKVPLGTLAVRQYLEEIRERNH
jgi:hypothetical protein